MTKGGKFLRDSVATKMEQQYEEYKDLYPLMLFMLFLGWTSQHLSADLSIFHRPGVPTSSTAFNGMMGGRPQEEALEFKRQEEMATVTAVRAELFRML